MRFFIIRHIGKHADGQQYSFRVECQNNGRCGDETTMTAPDGFHLEDYPESNFSQDLHWYLEEYLDYPFHLKHGYRAEKIQKTLRAWGRQAFHALFGNNSGHDFYKQVCAENDLEHLTLRIVSDDPAVLAWPWEALYDPIESRLVETFRIERRLNESADLTGLSAELPRNRINVLMLTARFAEHDTGFRTLARSLKALIDEEHLPVHIDILRPPTFEQLRLVLQQRRNDYHIVHFDTYASNDPGAALIFENATGKPDLIEVDRLADLFKEHPVPIVAINVCAAKQSGEGLENTLAEIAVRFQQAGISSVLTTAYPLYNNAIRCFFADFYRYLFQSDNVTEAVYRGRLAMLQQKNRICSAGEYPLMDWLTPTLYQQQLSALSFDQAMHDAASPVQADPAAVELPPEVRRSQQLLGLIGRDHVLLVLERMLRQAPSGILLYGGVAIGKTTLVAGFLQWLANTGALSQPPLWLAFENIHSAAQLIDELCAALFGREPLSVDREKKCAMLVSRLKEHPYLMVWDGLESANLPEADRQVLKNLLLQLRDTDSRILMTSRRQELWLEEDCCTRVSLSGLSGEERWLYCESVIRHAALPVKRDDPRLSQLMDLIGGHPLLMQVMLSWLCRHDAQFLIKRLHDCLPDNVKGNPRAELFATIALAQILTKKQSASSLPAKLQKITVEEEYRTYQSKLLATYDESDNRLPVDLLKEGDKAYQKRHYEQAEQCYRKALMINEKLQNEDSLANNYHRLGNVAYQQSHYRQAGQYYKQALTINEKRRNEDNAAVIYCQLGNMAFQVADYVRAGQFYQHSLTINEYYGDARDAIGNYLQLGKIAEIQNNFSVAEQWYQKALLWEEKTGKKQDAANIYYRLGQLAFRQRDLDRAKQYLQKSLTSGISATDKYLLLGNIAKTQHDYAQAELWFQKALINQEEQHNHREAALIVQQLGRLAEEQGDFSQAEYWSRKALRAFEKQHNEYGMASTYRYLGNLFQEQNDYTQAEQCYQQALGLNNTLNNEYGIALTYYQLANLTLEQDDYTAAEKWYRKSLEISEKQANQYITANSYQCLGQIAEKQEHYAQAEQWYAKALPILENQHDRYMTAIIYMHLGVINRLQQKPRASADWLLKAMSLFRDNKIQFIVEQINHHFVTTYQEAPYATQEELKSAWNQADVGPFPESETETVSDEIVKNCLQ